MSWIYYLLEANLYLAAFYLVYYFVLRRETYYQLNRVYLMSICAIAFIIPLLQIGSLRRVIPPPPPPMAPVMVAVDQLNYQQPIAPITTAYVWTPADYYLLLYTAVAAIMLIGFGIKLYKLIQLSRKAKQNNNGFYLIEIADNNNAFSFFKYLFIDPKLANSQAIVQHELVHIRQKHSLDIVFLELFKIVNWFNPVVYLLQNSIKELHEFIADQETAQQQQDVNGYTDFLINNAYGCTESALANNFFNKNLLKTRIIMLHQKRSGSLARLKYLVILPLCASLLCASTLAFSKTYGYIDLLPHKANTDSRPASLNKLEHQPIPIPIGMPLHFVTKTGYEYLQAVYFFTENNKSDYSVTFTEKDGSKKEFYRSTAKPEDLELLNKKYGYNFPTDTIVHKTPPPPPPSAPTGIKYKGNQMPPPPPVFLKPEYIELGIYMQNHLKYPAMATSSHITGTVILNFRLDDKGMITDVKIEKGMGKGLDEEAVRLITGFKKAVKDSPGYHTIGLNFNIKGERFMETVSPEAKQKTGYVGEFLLPGQLRFPPPVVKPDATGQTPPKPKVSHIRFPPPVVTPDAAHKTPPPPPPKPKVTQIRFPPPVVKPDAAGQTPPKPKVSQIRFPPPVIIPDDTTGSAAFKDLYTQLSKTIRYAADARDNNIQGRVWVVFNVDDDRRIRNIKIVRGLTDIQNKEVVNRLGNCYVPEAAKTGVNYTIPITFRLVGDNGTIAKTDPAYQGKTYTDDYKPNSYPYKALHEIVIAGYGK